MHCLYLFSNICEKRKWIYYFYRIYSSEKSVNIGFSDASLLTSITGDNLTKPIFAKKTNKKKRTAPFFLSLIDKKRLE